MRTKSLSAYIKEDPGLSQFVEKHASVLSRLAERGILGYVIEFRKVKKSG